MTPMHFRPLRIWPTTASSTHHFPLGFILQHCITYNYPTYYSDSWYHSFMLFYLRSLFLSQFTWPSIHILPSKPSSDIISSNKLPLTFSAKRNNHFFTLCALNLLPLIYRFHHIMNDLFISSPLPWASQSQAGFILVLCAF